MTETDNPDFLDLEPTPPAEASGEAEPAAALEAEPPAAVKPTVTFMGNTYDLTAVVGLTIGAVMLLSCLTCNMGFYCMPFIPVILGVIGLLAAKDSVDPERTKLLSWLGLGSGALVLLLIFIFAVLYIGFIVVAIAADGGF